MQKISHKEMKEYLVFCYRARVAPFFWGAPGIGKSESALAVAKYLAIKEKRELKIWNEITRDEKLLLMKDPSKAFIYSDVRLSQVDPADLRGIPTFIGDGDAVDWKQSLVFLTLGHPEAKGMLMFDEMNLAPPSVQAAAYQIINDRQIGEYPLNKKILILAAGNRAEDRAATFDLGAPLRNRLIHFELMVPSAAQWIDWAIDKGVDSRIISYIQFRPTNLFTFKENPNAMAFATPRTWKKTSDLISFVKGTSERDLIRIERLAAAAVGDGPAVELKQFLTLQNMLDIDDIIRYPGKASKITKVDEKWALVTGIGERYKTMKAKEFNIENAFQIVSYMDPEFGILLLRLMRRARGKQALRARGIMSPAFQDFVNKHDKVLSATSTELAAAA